MWKHFGISYGEMPNNMTNNSYFNNPKLRYIQDYPREETSQSFR